MMKLKKRLIFGPSIPISNLKKRKQVPFILKSGLRKRSMEMVIHLMDLEEPLLTHSFQSMVEMLILMIKNIGPLMIIEAATYSKQWLMSLAILSDYHIQTTAQRSWLHFIRDINPMS